MKNTKIDPRSLRLARFQDVQLDELVEMWRESFEQGVGVRDVHPIDEQKQYFMTQVAPHHEVRVALLEEKIVGFVAASRESVSQLYVRCGYHRVGIGTWLLDWAKAQSSGRLWLYTFAQNERACAFYERSGFREEERGFEEHSKLKNVKYTWTGD
jgi:ribosomal protein S18 acetylase RimI-like enzyme